MDSDEGWHRAAAALAVALVCGAALFAFQYFVVFRSLIGFSPEQPFPVTSNQSWNCFRALVFIGPRNGCPESFTSEASFGVAALVNLLACLCATLLPVLRAGGLRTIGPSQGRVIGLSASLLLAVPLLAWSLVSSFGILIGPALAD